ncbi:MAG TPA: PEP-CTERM sorting domain-containing protein [Tepidisphaeraceae bacterium]|jgi:hypothetical protein|nr:PEP-CTERM sorting domain-containing protein [Tepidisphaeraceae bacterium]
MSNIRTASAFFALGILAVAQVNAAILTGSVAPPAASNNLTTEGALDWIHWGLNTATDVNRKATGLSQISNFTTVGSGTTVVRLTNSASKYSWIDGSPTLTATNTPGGVYVNNFDGPGRGFIFTVPADLLQRVLRVYIGEFSASGTLQATLSDNSAPAFSLVLTGAADQTVQGVYTLDYAAASLGQTLTVKWTETTDLGTADNVTMQAATLSLPIIPEPATLLSMASAALLILARRRSR